MSNSGKGSKRRPTDQQKFDENFEKIFGGKPNNNQFDNMQKKEEWREEIINERQQESLTKRVKWKPLKEKDNDS
jgi:uncharacterized protein with von Willebrand factor type A (vWA) domain